MATTITITKEADGLFLHTCSASINPFRSNNPFETSGDNLVIQLDTATYNINYANVTIIDLTPTTFNAFANIAEVALKLNELGYGNFNRGGTTPISGNFTYDGTLTPINTYTLDFSSLGSMPAGYTVAITPKNVDSAVLSTSGWFISSQGSTQCDIEFIGIVNFEMDFDFSIISHT